MQKEKIEELVNNKAKELYTDAQSISIGQIVNLFKEKDLQLFPNFQRYFRWDEYQKSRLIESILVNIPIPTIFFSQDSKSNLDVVDGLQRLCTILQFIGELGELTPFKLTGLKILHELNGESWSSFPETLKKDFKRKSLMTVTILKIGSSETKYDLFDRINSGGTPTTSQEIRNAFIDREVPELNVLINDLASDENFIQACSLSDSQLEEMLDLELVIKFILLSDLDLKEMGQHVLNDFLSDRILSESSILLENRVQITKNFKRVFETIYNFSGDTAFKKFLTAKEVHRGGFLISMYEIVALGLSNNISNLETLEKEKFDKILLGFWTEFDGGGAKFNWKGMNSTNRVKKTIPLGRELFSIV